MAEIFGESRGTPNFDQSTIFLQPVWIRDPATNAFRFSRLETGPGNERSVCTPSSGGMRTERVKQMCKDGCIEEFLKQEVIGKATEVLQPQASEASKSTGHLERESIGVVNKHDPTYMYLILTVLIIIVIAGAILGGFWLYRYSRRRQSRRNKEVLFFLFSLILTVALFMLLDCYKEHHT